MKAKDQAIFYTNDVAEGLVTLREQEAVHCALVLRKQIGDLIWVTDGQGNKYTCGIASVSKREVRCEIIRSEFYDRDTSLQLAVAPTKNRDRMEWMVEKAVEIGVSAIHLVRTERTERQRSNLERLQKKALSAMKQSQRYHLPEIREWEWAGLLEHATGARFVAHCLDAEDKADATALMKRGEKWVLIGPEGDFTQEEVDQAIKAGWRPLDLGQARLRTETAALAVCVWSKAI